MAKTLFLVGILLLSTLPLVASAAPTCNPSLCQPPVGVCAKIDGCSGGHDVCVYGFSWVPQCKDVPCLGSPQCFETAQSVQCMERYMRMDVGPVSVISRNSCDYQVYYNGQPVLG